jgi:regulatory protein
VTMRSARPAPVSAERAADPAAAREAALRLLERTRRTGSDLARRLRDKGYAPAIITPVIERLIEVGLVDDVEYARAFLAERWGRRAAGWRRLEQELKRRGIAGEHIAAARARLEEREGAVSEVEGARKAIAQAARRYASLDPRTRRQRLYALLARRGFDSDTIQAALSEAEGRRDDSGDDEGD